MPSCCIYPMGCDGMPWNLYCLYRAADRFKFFQTLRDNLLLNEALCMQPTGGNHSQQSASLMAQRLSIQLQCRSLGWEDPLEKDMATQSSVLA